MGGGGSTTMKQNADPWAGAIPYLLGKDNPQTPEDESGSGIFPDARKLYDSGKNYSPQMQAINDLYSSYIKDRALSPEMQYAQNGAGQIMQGAFDANFGDVANIRGPQDIRAQNIGAPQTNLVQARSAQGALNPTQAMQQMLSGIPNNPYLDQQAAAITGQMTRNLQENVMPGIRSEALASGQYGGSRQGIAEGLAASRMNQDLAPALTQLYGGAFENAQQRMAATAGSLNDQAFNNAQANATRQFGANVQNVANNLEAQKTNAGLDLNAQQFNANLGLQNNAQQLQRNTQNLNNRLQGVNLLGTTQNMQDNNYAAMMGALQSPNDYQWSQLSNYNSLINPTVGQTTSQNANKNRLAGGLGGALAGGMLGASAAGMLGSAGGAAGGAVAGAEVGSAVPVYGTAIGAILGGLAGAFM